MHSPSRKPIIALIAISDFWAMNRERLQAPWRALAFRQKALDSTLSARIIEHASAVFSKFSNTIDRLLIRLP